MTTESDHDPDTTRTAAALGPLEAVPTRVGQSMVHRSADDLELVELASRYLLGERLGAGGMGYVVEAYDPRMRREIALKRPHPNRDDGGRILAEARIQSALEHPAIVPVYEVGRDHEGRTYFTMRRLEGVSLAEVLREPDASRESYVAARWSLSRLLRAFVDVCLAVEYAHSRGVVHCDLKPGNVLFGEFGEVYVLDWGTARRYRAAEDPDLDVPSRPRVTEGTPAYMAPEQFRTDVPLDPGCDVFSLGAILFELLVGEPLHPRRSTALAIEAEYIKGETVISPIARAPDRGISPELDWLCQVALRIDPGERLASARQLADGVQAYLDGDRDVERRRSIAAQHVREAEELLDSYLADPGEPSLRAASFREAARALSYDPTHEVARDVVTRLLFEAPPEIPPEVRQEVERQHAHVIARQAELIALTYAIMLVALPAFASGGVRSWPLLGGIVALTLALIANALYLRRHPIQPAARVLARSAGDALLVGALASLCGPFSLPPAAALMAALLHVGSPTIKRPYLVPLFHVLVPIVPMVAMYAAGWVPFVVQEDAITIPAYAAWFDPRVTTVSLLAFPPLMLALASLVRARTLVAAREEQLSHALQRWHLRQIVDLGRRSDAGEEVAGAD